MISCSEKIEIIDFMPASSSYKPLQTKPKLSGPNSKYELITMIMIQLTLIINIVLFLLHIGLVSIRLQLSLRQISLAHGKVCWTCASLSLQHKSSRRPISRYQAQKSRAVPQQTAS